MTKQQFNGLMSSGSDNWATPKNLYNKFMAIGCFDPCPYNEGPIEVDGLAIEWRAINFVNPPYSNLKAWILKSIEEHKKGRQVVLLIPARTDTKGFKMLSEYGARFEFITGRLHFNDVKQSAPFPSVLVTLLGGGENVITFTDAKELEAPVNIE